MSSPVKLKAEESAINSIRRFPPFPHELLSRIISFACRLPPLPSDEAAAALPSPPQTALDLDLLTASSLALVCQGFYAATTPILYEHVRLIRPSALASFQKALAFGPRLGLLAKSLHIGPDDRLGEWWPVERSVGTAESNVGGDLLWWIKTSFNGPQDKQLLPRWCQEQRFPLEQLIFPPDCRGIAITEAVRAAQLAIGVDLCHQPLGYPKQNIGLEEWLKRVLEVQAALELFVAAMRAREDVSDDYEDSWRAKAPNRQRVLRPPSSCRAEGCGHYQRLRLTGWSPPQRRKPEGNAIVQSQPPLVISRAQVVQHLARPGATTDRFDHPLLFLRSGTSMQELESNGRIGAFNNNDEDENEDMDLVDPTDRRGFFGHETSEFQSGDINILPKKGKTIVPLPTIPSLLELARSVLDLAKNASNISLSGFLERALCSSLIAPPPRLLALRSLSIGPPPPHWRSTLELHPPVLAQVKHLRIAGVMLYRNEMQDLELYCEQLEEMEWAMGDCHTPYKHPTSLRKTILQLLLPRVTRLSEGLQDDKVEQNQNELFPNNKQDDIEPPPNVPSPIILPLITIKLHPGDLARVCPTIHGRKIRDALLQGTPLPNEVAARRVLLMESNAARVGVSRRSREMISDGWIVLYGEGREWWARQGGGR